MEPEIIATFHIVTATWQYIVFDPQTRDGVIIDSVLDFDPVSRKISTASADGILKTVKQEAIRITRVMETHAHADHLTAARYLQQKLAMIQKHKPAVCIGKRIAVVQETFRVRYGIEASELADVFDHLFDDNEEFYLGEIKCQVLYLPGHTPDHIGYIIGSNVFTGDSIFNPDVGSARADFPGGSATSLYASTRKLLSLPGHYKLYTGHDYPPEERPVSVGGTSKYVAFTTVAEQNGSNKHVKAGTSESDFVTWRAKRDATLGEPRLLHQSLQWNIRGGRLPKADENGMRMLRVPLMLDGEVLAVMEGIAEDCHDDTSH